MLKASISMKCGLSSRLRISNNVRRCYITRSIPICCENIDVEETKVYRLLTNWPGKYRFDINVVMKEISENETMAAEAKLRNIDARSWTTYVSTYRRKLVKEPISCFGDNKELLQFCDILDAMLNEADEAEVVGEFDNIDKPEKPSFIKCKNFLFDIMIKDAEVELSETILMYKSLCETADLRSPNEWYPYARLIKRKIIYHGGPTNSGKTYQALQRLRSANHENGGGLYCGPLRLLALEVYESLNKQGVYTNLLTGQERKEIDFATHVSCTVEMVKLDKGYDVAVIDEIQMIANNERGWAWTRALLGLRAKEIHVCGGLEAAVVVKALAESVGDDFELIEYKRLSTLQINEVSLKGDYANIQPGDCVVAFSKADIFSIRRQIETLTSHKCAMIYGQLPSETRSTQARLFNDEGTGYDVLVASDAIGMGLNLNIKRIVFHTTLKIMGKDTYFVDPSSVKQIAGRAGRLSSAYKIGEVTAWQEADLAYIRSVMSWEIPAISSAGIFPSVEQIDLYSTHLANSSVLHSKNEAESESEVNLDELSFGSESESAVSEILVDNGRNITDNSDMTDLTLSSFPDPLYTKNSYNISSSSSKFTNVNVPLDNTRLSHLLERFIENSKTNEDFFLCDHEAIIIVSNWLHTIPLTLAERFVFANAPVDIRNQTSMALLYQFAATYAMRRPVALNVRLSRQKPRDVIELSDLCTKHNSLDLYLWLSFRFPEYFVEQELCLDQKAFAINVIESSLDRPELQHKFSHSQAYSIMRKKSKESIPDGLPPIKYGISIRATTAENLRKISSDELYVYPRLREEEGESGPTLTRDRFTRKTINPNYKGKHPNYSNSQGSNNLGKKVTPHSNSNQSNLKNGEDKTNVVRDNSNFLKNSNFCKKLPEKKDNSNFLKSSNFVRKTSEPKDDGSANNNDKRYTKSSDEPIKKKSWSRGNN